MAILSPANAATLLNIDLRVKADRLLQTSSWQTANLSAMSLEDKNDLKVALLHLAYPSKKMKNLYDEEVDITALRDSFKDLDTTLLLGPREALLFYLFKNKSLDIWGPWMKSFEENTDFQRLGSPFFMFLTAVDSDKKTDPSIEKRLDLLLTAIQNDEVTTKWLLHSLNQRANIQRLVMHGSPVLQIALRKYLSSMIDYPGINLKTNANLARYINSPERFTGGSCSPYRGKDRNPYRGKDRTRKQKQHNRKRVTRQSKRRHH